MLGAKAFEDVSHSFEDHFEESSRYFEGSMVPNHYSMENVNNSNSNFAHIHIISAHSFS